MFFDVVPLQASSDNAGEIGKQLALIAAVAAAMQLFLAPTLHAQIEALQASKLVPKRYGGVAAIILGAVYGLVVGTLGVTQTEEGWALLLVGLLGGVVAGGGAVIADQRIDGVVAGKSAGAAAVEATVANASTTPPVASGETVLAERNGDSGPEDTLVPDEIGSQPATNGAGALTGSGAPAAGPH